MGPLTVYINWAAYDELSDNVELTEALAMRQLDELLRLRSHGVHFNAYLMDAFWYAPDGGYRTWRKPHWPDGPDRWLRACLESGLLPGLWLSTNTLAGLDPHPTWQDSQDGERRAMCLFEGGFLPDLQEVLQTWYDRGVRLFKFDFANLAAAPPSGQSPARVTGRNLTPDEIRALNSSALREALVAFRRRNPGVRFLAYNGFGGDQANTSLPFRRNTDLRWLEAFDSLYCGDPRPADVPAMNFWRSKDIYSDHMVRRYEQNSVPLSRIDNSGFMIGATGTCYGRKTAAWQGMLLLSLVRGGWMNTYYGDLGLLDNAQAAWFARAQALFLPLQAHGRICTFGAIPGERSPYGYVAVGERGSLYTVVNPSQAVASVRLPAVSTDQPALEGGEILFCDAGFRPKLAGDVFTLGPEQMALVGFGEYSRPRYDLGIQKDVIIPSAIRRLEADFVVTGPNEISATVVTGSSGPQRRNGCSDSESPDGRSAMTLAPGRGEFRLRIIMTQSRDGLANRSTGGAPPNGRTLGTMLRLSAQQDGRELPVRIEYDKAIWSGLSWAVGEVGQEDIRPSSPLRIVCSSAEPTPLDLAAELYEVTYER